MAARGLGRPVQLDHLQFGDRFDRLARRDRTHDAQVHYRSSLEHPHELEHSIQKGLQLELSRGRQVHFGNIQYRHPSPPPYRSADGPAASTITPSPGAAATSGPTAAAAEAASR